MSVQSLQNVKISDFCFEDGIASAAIRSLTDPKIVYGVVVDVEKGWFHCSCIGFRVHKKCKHLKIFLKLLHETLHISDEKYKFLLSKLERGDIDA